MVLLCNFAKITITEFAAPTPSYLPSIRFLGKQS